MSGLVNIESNAIAAISAGGLLLSMIKICVICNSPFAQSHKNINCCSNKCGQALRRLNFDNALASRIGIPIKDWLIDHYLNQFQTYRQICAELSINTRTLMSYMKQYNIPIRKGSEAIKVQWINNDARRKAQSEFLKSIPHPSGDDNPTRRPEVREKIRQSKLGSKNPMYNVLGKDNPRWKGGKMTLRGKGWNTIRTQVLRRDNNTCQQCGSKEKLEVHHIVTYRNKKNFNKLTNLVTLCRVCHRNQLSHKL